MSPGRADSRYVWRKLASAKWEDAWIERLAFVRERLAVTLVGRARMMRLEAYSLRREEAQRLVRAFGGTMEAQRPARDFMRAPPRPPIAIRGKLLIVSSAEELRVLSHKRGRAGPRIIHIPAEMAFGTGDHATTASCLRLLADVSAGFVNRPWELLDLGTGTGILAISARALGARHVKACDFDAAAVRVARENIRRNGVDRIAVVRLDVRRWKSSMRKWNVIVANLYSELLIEVFPKIAAAVAHDGHFIFSGVLRSQEKGLLTALRAAHFKLVRIVRRGKWIAGHATQARRHPERSSAVAKWRAERS